MKKEKSKKNILTLVILTTITIFCWIGFEIYRALRDPSISPVLQEQLEPLDPNFDKKTLESLEKRRSISEEELDSVPEITQFDLEAEPATPEANISSTDSVIPPSEESF